MKDKLIRLLMQQFPGSDYSDHEQTAMKIMSLFGTTRELMNRAAEDIYSRSVPVENLVDEPAIEHHSIPVVKKITPRSVMRDEEEK